jgi:hypothetical protein
MLGRWEDAVLVTTEAVGLYRRLAANNPTEFEPDLAGSLNNLSMMLSDLGLHRDALAASTQTVDIRRRLAADNRSAYEPGLAMALNNQSVSYRIWVDATTPRPPAAKPSRSTAD